MGTISKTAQHQMESFRLKQMRLDELTQPAWEYAVEYTHNQDIKNEMTELTCPAVVNPQTDTTEPTPSSTTFG
jgi:hypothetical protein